ncbi:carbohydrate ABC transporter permease [Reinekea marina]|uniref:Carbohydrate ABC transporter permease n=1 Tax=Reinekea marina TaxID=1310421 RepID=A0ABV7WRB4_9GAMM|nr:carbohydrate ABC transporter permease [Reinekea marina]MDN3647847.1 carbohydrate ABC transporter permease [Reinekea marina]
MNINSKNQRALWSVLKRMPVVAFSFFVIWPLVPIFYLSFQSTLEHPSIEAGQWTLLNFQHLFKNEALVNSIVNSLTYVALNIAITLPVALPAAYGFARYRFIGDKHVFLWLLACRMTPPVVMVFPVFQLFSALGLVNSPLAIALAHCLFTVPITIWILESFISAIPKEFDETAFIDGYSFLGFFFKLLVPTLKPGIAVAAFFCFMFSWVEVVFARILTVTNGKPISMAISSLFSFQTDMGLVMAMSLLSIVPGAILMFLMRHHLSAGFMVGGAR